MQRAYLVSFHKVVPDDTGHDHRVLQQQAVVRARADVSAAYAAKAIDLAPGHAVILKLGYVVQERDDEEEPV